MALASLKSLSWFILIGSIDLKIIVLLLLSWTVAHQAPLSMEFSRQEYWSGQPFPFPRDPPDSGIEPWSSALQADSLPCEPPEKPISIKKKKNYKWVLTIYQALCFVLYMHCGCYYYSHFIVGKNWCYERLSDLSKVPKAVWGRTRIRTRQLPFRGSILTLSITLYCLLIPVHSDKPDWAPKLDSPGAVANSLSRKLESILGKEYKVNI